MVIGRMLGSLIGTALGVRGKAHHGARSFLTGGPSSFLNTSTLLTAAGLAATAYTLYRAHQTATPMSSSTVAGGPLPPMPPTTPGPPMSPMSPQSPMTPMTQAPPGPPTPPMTQGPAMKPVPPPVPSAPSVLAAAPPSAARASAAPPFVAPSTSDAPSISPSSGASTDAPVDALTRIVAIALAAARCDGDLGEDEFGRLLQVAREHKAESIVARELAAARPLADLAAGVGDAQHKADLYVLAYGIVRADESVSSAERAWLTQWASLLGLDASTVQRLEKDAALRIASAPASDARA